MANVFNRKGGSKSGRDGLLHPDAVERLALGVAVAVRLAFVRTGMTNSINFRLTVAEEVKRSGATRQLWPEKIILTDVFYLMFHKMNDGVIERFIKYQFKPLRGLTGDARAEEEQDIKKNIVQLCLYLLLASIKDLCHSWDEFVEKAEEAKLDTLLRNRTLGGRDDWVRSHQLTRLGQCLGPLLGQLLGPHRPASARIGPHRPTSARVSTRQHASASVGKRLSRWPASLCPPHAASAASPMTAHLCSGLRRYWEH